MEGHRNSEGEGILKANIFEWKSEIQMEYPKGQGQEKEIKTKQKTLKLIGCPETATELAACKESCVR